MRSLFLAVVVLLFSGVANANHHRAHALYFLDRVEGDLRRAQLLYDDIVTVADFENPLAGVHYSSLEFNVFIKIPQQIEAARAKLLEIPSCKAYDANLVLSETRAIVTQPNLTFQPQSLNYAIHNAVVQLSRLTERAEPHELDTRALGKMALELSSVWTNFDFVIWHITDAHLEEVDNLSEKGAGHDPAIDPAGLAQAFIFDPCQ